MTSSPNNDHYGIPTENWSQIQETFSKFKEIEWVKLYGSRAMGTHKPGSDIDLTYQSKNADITAKLLAALDQLSTPYLFDVSNNAELRNENLKDHIDRVGITIYKSA